MGLSMTIMVSACLLAIEDGVLTLDEKPDSRRTPLEESQGW
jgi:hypothetical protein